VHDLAELNVHLRGCCLAARERTCGDNTVSVGVRFEQDKAAALAPQFAEGLRRLGEHPLVGEARGLGTALGLTSVLYVVGAGLILLLPETRGREIE